MKFVKENLHYLLLFSAAFFLGNPAKFPVDDGFFYPQIAYNIVNHGFMGFNDLYLTNGFHPLWMVFCIIAEAVNPFGKEFSLYIIWFFQVSFIFLGYRLLEKTFFKDSGIGKMLALAFYCLIFFSLGTLYLTEAHLAFFTIALLLYYIFRKYKNDFLFGFICSLVFLARLDHIFLIFPLGFLYWKEQKWSVRSIGMMLVGFAVLSIPYLCSNQYVFGDFVPISGKIKSTFPVIVDDIPFTFLTKFFIYTGLGYLFFLLFNKNTPYRIIKIVFLIGTFIHLLYNILFQTNFGQWYFVSQYILCGFFINDFVQTFFGSKVLKSKISFGVLTIILTVFVGFIGYLKLTTTLSIFSNILNSKSKLEKHSEDSIKNVSEDLMKNIPEKSRIYIYDFPGKFAFYSHFNYIPADALVANSKFFGEIDSLPFKDYLKKNKIDYLLFPNSISKKREWIEFMGMGVKRKNNEYTFFFKNTLKNIPIKDVLEEKDLIKIKTYPNPVKIWQPDYDSVCIYKLKK